jgi:TolB protein
MEGRVHAAAFEAEDLSPCFHPSDSQMAYASNRSGKYHIWVRDVTGKTGARELTKFEHDMSPAWSPDGKTIAFQSYGRQRNGPFAIWLIDSDGTNARRLIAPDPEGDQYPSWSPDGKWLVWTHGNRLWVADVNGRNAHPLTAGTGEGGHGFQYGGQWSPAGDRIVYLESDSDMGADYKVWVVRADGTDRKKVAGGIAAHHLKWSKDGGGRYLYLTSGGWLVRMNANEREVEAGSIKRLFNLQNEDSDFDISPDGNWLVYDDSGPDGTGKIYRKRFPVR